MAMKEVMRFAETALGMKECVTVYAKANTSSVNVLHKLGFIDEAEILYECSGGEIITEGQGEDYHEIIWSQNLKDDEVVSLHILTDIAEELSGVTNHYYKMRERSQSK